MGDPPGAGQLERQQRQQIRQGRDPGRGRVAGGGHHVRQAERDQVRDDQQQPGQPGLSALGQGGEVQGLGAGLDLPGRPAALSVGAAPQPRQPLIRDHLGDPGPVQRGAFGGQRGGDLVNGVPGGTQFQDPGPGGVLARRGPGPGLAGNKELPRSGAEIPHRRGQRRRRIPEPGGGLGGRQPLGEVGPQRLVPAVRRRVRAEEEFPAGPGRLRLFR
jgi:hypothetical protein